MHKRITVLLSEEEYTQVRKNAGLVPLSRFLKNLGLGEKHPTPKPFVRPSSKSVMEEYAEAIDRVEDVPRNKRVPVAKRSAPESQGISAPWQAGKKCLCGEIWEEHRNGGRCLAEGCKCDKFEEA